MSNPQAWFHLGDQKTTENVNAIQNILDSAAQVLVEKIQNEPEENSEFVIKTTENVQLQVKHVKESQIKSKLGPKSEISLKIAQENQTADAVVVLKSYENLGCILNGQKNCQNPSSKSKKQVQKNFIFYMIYTNHDFRLILKL